MNGHMLLACLLFAAPVAAQTRDDNWTRCRGDNADLKIGGCTALIRSGSESNTDLADAFLQRGIGYFDTDEYDKAIADFDESIRLNPVATAFHERGLTYWAKRQYPKAIQDFDEAIRRSPSSYMAYVMRGSVHDDNGELDAAIQDYASAIRLEPSNARAYTERCVALSKKGSYDAAIADCDKAIELNPAAANAWATRGRSYAAKGDLDRGLLELNKALTLNPSRIATGTIYRSRGTIRFRRGEFQLAIADFDAALKIDPRSPEALYGRGMARRRAGSVQEGDADIASAKQVNSDIADVMARLGVK